MTMRTHRVRGGGFERRWIRTIAPDEIELTLDYIIRTDKLPGWMQCRACESGGDGERSSKGGERESETESG